MWWSSLSQSSDYAYLYCWSRKSFFGGLFEGSRKGQVADMRACRFDTHGWAPERWRKNVGPKKKWCKHQILELIPSFYRHLLGCRRPLPIGMSQGCGQHHKHLLWDRGRKGRAMSRLQINYHHFSPSSLFPSAFGVGDCGVLAVFPTCHFFTSRDYKDHLWFPCTWSVSLFWVWTVSLLCVWHTALYRKCWLIMSHPELGRWFSLEWGF